MVLRNYYACCAILVFGFLLGFSAAQNPSVVQSWDFSDPDVSAKWPHRNYLKDFVVDQGCFSATVSGGDPFVISPDVDFPATSFQYVEIELKTNSGGQGELFYTGNTEGPFGGLSQQKSLTWPVVGDNQWHTYRVHPDWLGEGRIKRFRVDFPAPVYRDGIEPKIELKAIRIVQLNPENAANVTPDWNFNAQTEGWMPQGRTTLEKMPKGWTLTSTANETPGMESRLFAFSVTEKESWLSAELACSGTRSAKLEWVNDRGKAVALEFPVRADGKPHWYNIPIPDTQKTGGKIHWLKFSLGKDGMASGSISRLIISDKPQGPADVTLEKIWFSEPINRVGMMVPLSFVLKNHGGATSSGLQAKIAGISRNITLESKDNQLVTPEIGPMETVTGVLNFKALEPGIAEVELQWNGNAAPKGQYAASGVITPNLNLAKADYVPEPKPIESDYEIGAFYFPGWATHKQWKRIMSTHPERKPVLGWYDEGNSEVIDWQIKWAAENGIQFFLVDWYWSRGQKQLEHWVQGFQKARYKSYLKWCMMWANHNGPGSHSEEDQRKVTQYWIDNYFNTPEYYTIDGKPVVMIWSPEGMDDDVIAIERAKGVELKKGEGVKKLLDLSRKMAQDAGYSDIYFIAMKWPEATAEAGDIQWLAEAGFDMTSIYHYMDHGGKAVDPMRFSFDLVRDSNSAHWQKFQKTGILPFLSNISTGWDSRPWHGDENVIIEDRTPEKFRKICDDAVAFAKETGNKRFALGPLNEWGEGSYAEPNLEHGFKMYETLREVFGKKPVTGWPLNYAPSDVGLGPYDLPESEGP